MGRLAVCSCRPVWQHGTTGCLQLPSGVPCAARPGQQPLNSPLPTLPSYPAGWTFEFADSGRFRNALGDALYTYREHKDSYRWATCLVSLKLKLSCMLGGACVLWMRCTRSMSARARPGGQCVLFCAPSRSLRALVPPQHLHCTYCC